MKRKDFLNLNQGKTSACVAYTVSNIIYYLSKEVVSPIMIFKKAREFMDIDNTKGLNFPAINKLLGKYYDIVKLSKDLESLYITVMIEETPIAVSVNMQLIDPKAVSGRHAVIIYKIQGDVIYYVNSWGETWGPHNDNSGYFVYDKKHINWAFKIKLNSDKTK